MQKNKWYLLFGNLIKFTDRILNLYLYYIIVACFLSLVPNINSNYPLFHFIFKSAGFYILKPFFGFSFCPMLLMMGLVLLSLGLRKIYDKYFHIEQEVYIISAKDFIEKVNNRDMDFLKNLGKKSENNTQESESEDKK